MSIGLWLRHGGNLRRACDCTLPVVTTFAFSMTAFLVPRALSFLCVLAVIYILFQVKCRVGVLLLSVPWPWPQLQTQAPEVVVGKIHKNHHERAVIYWSWTA